MISPQYLEEQKKLHKFADYGSASKSQAPFVSNFINKMGITEMLDYGAGKGELAKSLQVDHDVQVKHYDPAIEEWSKSPDSAQLVCCIDVLEHIEPEFIEEVLDDLQRCVEFFGIFTIHTGPASKTLSDGRNAHLIQAPSKWWLDHITQRFDLIHFQKLKQGFVVIVQTYGD